ncbi:MAG: hypothetical protein WCK05_10735 [Planctomycetota bacterium]
MAKIHAVRTFGPVLRRHAVALCFCVGALCAPVLGDKILAKGNYLVPLTKITGFRGGAVVYLTPSGAEMEKPLRDIVQITIDGQVAFNQAEELRQATKTADAADFYDTAIKAENPPWLIELARQRKTAGSEADGESPKTRPADGGTDRGTNPKPIWPVVSFLLQGLQEAQHGTTLQREELTKKAFADAKGRLAGKTFSLSFPILDLTKQGDGCLVTFDSPAELAQYSEPPKYRISMVIRVPMSEAMRFKSGDLFTITGKMRCLKAGETTAAKDIGLLDGGSWWLVTDDYKYAVQSAKATGAGTPDDPGKERQDVGAPASKPGGKAGVVTMDELLPVLLTGLAKAKQAETTLQKKELGKKAIEDVTAKLAMATYETSYIISNVDRVQGGFALTLDSPRLDLQGVASSYDCLYRFRVNLSEADALKVKPGWLVTIRCKAICVMSGGASKLPRPAKEWLVLFKIYASTVGEHVQLLTSDYKYTVHPAPEPGGME